MSGIRRPGALAGGSLALIPFAVLTVLLYLAGREVILASKPART